MFEGLALVRFSSEDSYGHERAAPGIFIPESPGDPTDFDSYLGQQNIKRRIELRLNAMQRGDSLKLLLSASAGLGKTSFIRVLAREMALRGLIDHYFEIVAGKIRNKEKLDEFMHRLPSHCLIFIDEIHGLKGSARDSLLPAIQDNVYPFDRYGDTATPLPAGISWAGATTDVGKVHKALQRRLNVVTLEDLSFTDKIVLASILPVKVSERAAVEMAKRCFTPWEIKDEVYQVSRDLSLEKQDQNIQIEHVLEACQILGIDEIGLRPKEREVLSALYNSQRKVKGEIRYALSASAIVAAVGIDRQTFYDSIEPKLIKMGFITVSSGVGRELTSRGVKLFEK